MTLQIETFSSLKGGNIFFKAVTHPEIGDKATALIAKLRQAKSVAVYDPLGFAEGFWSCWNVGSIKITGVYAQSVLELGKTRLGEIIRPVTQLKECDASLVFVVAFDAAKLSHHIRQFVPDGAAIVSLDEIRQEESHLTNRNNYLDPLNFATNFALFRDSGTLHTRVVTANYWGSRGAVSPTMALTLFSGDGAVLARWDEALGAANATMVVDSREIRARFDLPEFTGQLFIQIVGGAGHDVVKFALDTFEDDGLSLSCTHDANSWPADFYAGLPAPRDDESVILWIQNSLPIPIPAGDITLNLMGDDHQVTCPQTVPPFASLAINVADLLPAAKWPQQIEIGTGRHVVRPRYEVVRGRRRRIAHANVERTDLKPNAEIAEFSPLLGKGFILPAPLLPPDRWRSIVLPTPMATTQQFLPVAATLYDETGRPIGEHRFGRLPRRLSVALDLDNLLPRSNRPNFGHVELTYDWNAGADADGWLHALFRFEDRATDHSAENSFGSHIFNTALTWRGEPQSYAGPAPGLSTRLFLRVGQPGLDTICHLIYPASTPWLRFSSTDLILLDASGAEIVTRRIEISCSGSYFWRYSETFSAAEIREAQGGAVIIRDVTCRLFGYHGLEAPGGRFSLDHMFGF